MRGGGGSGRQDWTQKGRLQRVSEQSASRAALLRSRAEAIRGKATTPHPTPNRRAHGISRPLQRPVSYLRTTAPEAFPLVLGSGRTLIEALFASMDDRRDRTVLTWPRRPENALVTAAIAIQEGKAAGRLGHAAIGIWPWRPALSWAARTILVDAGDVADMARRIADDSIAGLPWTKAPIALDAHTVLTASLRDLAGRRSSRFTVRHPTLLDLTPVFEPAASEAGAPYRSDPEQILRRVRDHTRISDMNGCEADHLRKLGDPSRTPFAVFGLPAGGKRLIRCLAFPRFAKMGLDLVIVDATRPARDQLGPEWDRRLAEALDAIYRMGEGRPGVVVVADDTFAARRAGAVVRERCEVARQGRRNAGRCGVLLQSDFLSPLGSHRAAVPALPAVRYRAELKDSSLLDIRRDFLGLAARLERQDEGPAARSLKAALSFLRRVCALPVGYAEARAIVATIHGSDDDLDRRVRARLFVDGGLAPLDEAIAAASGFRQELVAAHRRVTDRLDAWDLATPFSLKLADLRRRATADDLLVLPNADSLELFRASEAASKGVWRAVDAGRMAAALAAQSASRMILVQPTLETLREVLLLERSPPEVALLVDASSAALLQAELRPLAEMDAFSCVRGRAQALSREIGRAEADLVGDAADPEFEMPRDTKTLDFTQSGEGAPHYAGPVVRIVTEREWLVRHRPGGLVIRYTPSDIRAFERVEAARIEPGDAILVMTRPLLEAFRRELARAPKTLDTLRAYHADVAARCRDLPGASLAEKARRLATRINGTDHSFSVEEAGNVSRWLRVDGKTLDDPSAQPQAPSTWGRFRLFAGALGLPEALARTFWDYGIRPTRSYRIREGVMLHDRAVQFVVDPEGVMARAGGVRTYEALWQMIVESVDTVKSAKETRDA